jgi:CRP-like cAMP-binding protein
MRFQEVFYCSVFEAGEVIVAQGEKGSTAYLIEDGEVEVLIKGKDQLIPISTIGRGQLIGEIAMVTNEPRTASVISKTVTSCIAFDRSEFMRLLYSQPHRSLDIFKIFSKRLSESNRRLAEVGR